MTRLSEIKSRLEAATKGPWLFRGKSSSFHKESKTHPFGEAFILFAEDDNGAAIIPDADLQLIEHATSDIRFLLSELERHKAAIEAAKNLRIAQKAYMADRGNEMKGQIVGKFASLLDESLAKLIGGE